MRIHACRQVCISAEIFRRPCLLSLLADFVSDNLGLITWGQVPGNGAGCKRSYAAVTFLYKWQQTALYVLMLGIINSHPHPTPPQKMRLVYFTSRRKFSEWQPRFPYENIFFRLESSHSSSCSLAIYLGSEASFVWIYRSRESMRGHSTCVVLSWSLPYPDRLRPQARFYPVGV